jgi:hypothetical protein
VSGLLVPLAHAGHWINGALYLSPVLIIGALLFVQSRRDKDLDDDEDLGDDPEDQDEG